MITCPICHSEYANLRQHLRIIHYVYNLEERAILLKLARSRLPVINEVCPICAKKNIHTKRHVRKVHKNLSVSFDHLYFKLTMYEIALRV